MDDYKSTFLRGLSSFCNSKLFLATQAKLAPIPHLYTLAKVRAVPVCGIAKVTLRQTPLSPKYDGRLNLACYLHNHEINFFITTINNRMMSPIWRYSL